LNSSEHSAPAMFQKKKIVQSIYESDYRFVQEPEMPTLKATPGDGQVTLTWDDRAEKYTQEPLLRNANDFEGYKLYRATDKFFSDAEVLRDVYGNPAGKYPIYQCDLIDGIKGIFDASHLNGLNYYLGDDTGITNYYIDKEVENGRTYYYGLAAYDYGIDAEEIAVLPSENTVVFKLDENENIMPDIDQNPNVKAVTPYPPAAGYVSPFVDKEEDTQLFGNSEVTPQIFDDSEIKGGHSYKVVFDVDTLGNIAMSARFSRPDGLVKCNSGFSVYDMTEGGRLAYREDADNFNGDNISVEDEVYVGVRLATDVKYMNNTKEILTGVFDGIQLRMNLKARYGEYAPELSGWIVGDAPINITPSERQAAGYPHRYEIVFTNEDSAYVGKTDQDRRITNAEMAGGDFLLQHPFDFYIVNKMLMDSTGNPEICDLVVEDMDANGEFDKLVDRILVGYPFPQGDKIYWSGTVFVIDFLQAGDESNLPKPGDVYLVDFYRPFAEDDTISFKVDSGTDVDRQLLEQGLSEIKVVPNPYVATNTMEPALSNYLFNQRRRLMFTHIPARCTIKIFTSSGVFVDEIDVANSPENGIVHWDMLTSEGLEIAAGLYIYHIRAHTTGDEKVGKFAVIK
jgi:hypothetical protein